MCRADGPHRHGGDSHVEGAGPPVATNRAWYEARRRTLLESDAAGFLEELTSRGEESAELTEYLAPHENHTAYRHCLAEGRTIGSGLVEGACETAIGRRLKQTGARWRIRRLKHMAALYCLLYSDLFDAYWRQKAS